MLIGWRFAASICGPVGGRPDDPVIYSRGTIYHGGLIKPGTTPLTRFFYDPDHGRCIPFTYYGAGGNYNNFLSRVDCELFCSKCAQEKSPLSSTIENFSAMRQGQSAANRRSDAKLSDERRLSELARVQVGEGRLLSETAQVSVIVLVESSLDLQKPSARSRCESATAIAVCAVSGTTPPPKNANRSNTPAARETTTTLKR